jgi:hypothetical protein
MRSEIILGALTSTSATEAKEQLSVFVKSLHQKIRKLKEKDAKKSF